MEGPTDSPSIVKTPAPEGKVSTGAEEGSVLQTDQSQENLPMRDEHELLGWVCTLSVVFLASSTLNCLMRWFGRGTPWDAAGVVFSAVLTWLCYRLTLSEKVHLSIRDRWLAGTLPVIVWATLFPLIFWGLGFR